LALHPGRTKKFFGPAARAEERMCGGDESRPYPASTDPRYAAAVISTTVERYRGDQD